MLRVKAENPTLSKGTAQTLLACPTPYRSTIWNNSKLAP